MKLGVEIDRLPVVEPESAEEALEIARLKGLSVHTVQTHIKNLYGKLAVHSKSEAVFEATRLGLLSRSG